MTGQNDRPDESLTGQAHGQAGHCPLTGRYFEPCKYELIISFVLKIMEWLPEKFHALRSAHCGLENSGRLVIDANFNVVSWKERDGTMNCLEYLRHFHPLNDSCLTQRIRVLVLWSIILYISADFLLVRA